MSLDTGDTSDMNELFIWVLQDYDTEEWVLKHSVSMFQLFGKMSYRFDSYEVVTIHPDCNLVFFLEYGDCKLMSYGDCKLISDDMDTKEVCDVCTLGRGYGCITPYVAYFSDLSVLENKH